VLRDRRNGVQRGLNRGIRLGLLGRLGLQRRHGRADTGCEVGDLGGVRLERRDPRDQVAAKASKVPESSGGTVRDAVAQVMSDRVERGTRDIIKAVQARDPEANKNSINAAVYRMANLDPPLLIKRTVDGGFVYVLASAADETFGWDPPTQ
jgi:hypothetical protein